MTGKAVAKVEVAAVPALVQTPALQISADDIALDRIYFGQYMSQAVQAKLVELGDIYAAPSADDGDPTLLWKWSEDTEDPGVLIHVIQLTKRLSVQDGSGSLQLFDFGDPEAPADANVTYNYVLVCPELDQDIPYRMTLTRSGSKAARNMNTTMIRAAHTTPSYGLAFRLTSKIIKGGKGTYAEATVKSVEAEPANVAVAEKLFQSISQSQASQPASAPANEPAI